MIIGPQSILGRSGKPPRTKGGKKVRAEKTETIVLDDVNNESYEQSENYKFQKTTQAPKSVEQTFQKKSYDGAYRSFEDAKKIKSIYLEAKVALKAKKKRLAERKLKQYIKIGGKDAQYSDIVLYELARIKQNENDHKEAESLLKGLVTMNPPSAIRGLGYFRLSQSQTQLGQSSKGLETLFKVNLKEVPKKYHSNLFVYWGDLAFDQGKWLESSLAFLKARKQSGDRSLKNRLENIIKNNIQSKLREEDLEFLEKEYSTAFPLNDVQLRLVNLYLAQGKKAKAQLVINSLSSRSQSDRLLGKKISMLEKRMNSQNDFSTMRVGVLMPLSGRKASFGESFVKGLRIALRNYTKNNKKIEIVLADVGPTEQTALTAFERLVFQDKVMMVLGPLSGKKSQFLAQYSMEWGVPLVTLSPRPGLLKLGDTIFRVGFSPYGEMYSLISYAKEQYDYDRFAILFPEDNYGLEYSKAFFAAAKELGVKVTAAESYLPKNTDFKLHIENMVGLSFPYARSSEKGALIAHRQSTIGRPLTKSEKSKVELPPIADFQALVIPDTYRALGQIIPSLSYFNIRNVKLLGPSSWKSDRLLQRAGHYLKKAVVIDSFSLQRNNYVTKQLITVYQRDFGKGPNKIAAFGYDLGLAIRKVYSSSEINSREQLKSRLTNLGEVEGAAGKYVWDSSRDALKEAQLFQVNRGSFDYLGSVKVQGSLEQ